MCELPKKERIYLEHRKMLADDGLGAQIVEVAGVLNSKTSALLTHVSIMIAVTIALFSYFSSDKSPSIIVDIILISEIVAYLMISLFCLFSITMSGGGEGNLSLEKLILRRSHILTYRRRNYKIALYTTIIATYVLIATLLYEIGNRCNWGGIGKLM